MTKDNMVRGCASVLCAIFLGYCSIALAQSSAQAQQGQKPGQKGGTAGKEARWEGRVERSSKEQSSLTVRKSGSGLEKTCVYDGSTKWVSQYHASRRVRDAVRE